MHNHCHIGASRSWEETAVTIHPIEIEDAEVRAYLNNKRQRPYPTGAQVLQQNPKFKSLFDQLEYGPQARQAAAEALMRVSADFGPQSFTA